MDKKKIVALVGAIILAVAGMVMKFDVKAAICENQDAPAAQGQ